MTSTVLLWFRLDLRLLDNPALAAALQSGSAVIPVFVLDDSTPGTWPLGGASRWWLHHSLSRLDTALQAKGFHSMVYLKGDAFLQIQALAKDVKAKAVYWNRRYEPWAMERDTRLKKSLKAQKILAQSFSSYLLFEPWEVKNKTGGDYRVFTPFAKACLSHHIHHPERVPPDKPQMPEQVIKRLSLNDLGLHPSIAWHTTMSETWEPGEEGAQKRLKTFSTTAGEYKNTRDFPAMDGVSRLSPHLHFGEISPHHAWASLKNEAFRRQLLWREFSYHLLYHAQDMPDTEWNKKFTHFPWQKDGHLLRLWQKGQTGYPIVDAGMRQLWQTGWMHNRVRMIAGSFLVKNLLLNWREGEKWFWDTLVDADLANNAAGWQWIAGCGADAAPYFRIFNPVLQSKKFDPDGAYIKKHVPELQNCPKQFIHAPWDAPEDIKGRYKDYLPPVVDHATARTAALAAYEECKNAEID
ncbi:MAG: deoxyribodipyrimidine photo-lyase [Alphaproteobacteria bacterium]|nr:deoxyribodipyrimidine photo-lyase [Alphaproteobacteria bacterium]